MKLSTHTSSFLPSLFLNPIILKSSFKKKPQILRNPRNPLFLTRAMRAVVQRVTSASVEVEGSIVSQIGPGLLVLIGVHDSDTETDSNYMKVLNMRLFPNENTGKAWDQSVVQKNYEVLLVSQFTLYGTLKGNKPDFHVAMPPERSKPFYESLVEKFRKSYNPALIKENEQLKYISVAMIPRAAESQQRELHDLVLKEYRDGVFGAMMKVNLVNDGPVTLQLESPQTSKSKNDTEES